MENYAVATKQVTVPDFDTVLDVIGVVALAYLGWIWTGGTPLPLLKDFVPFIGAGTFGILGWRFFRRNNNAV